MRTVGAVLRVLLTFGVVAVAAVLGWRAWRVYTEAPWTRDGRVRAYVVTVAPEVAGRVVTLPVGDNQRVARGDVLFAIDDADYRIALETARAALQSAEANEAFRRAESARRASLSSLSVSAEQQQQAASDAAVAAAGVAQATSQLHRAELDLARTQVRAPVDGFVTNLALQQGDYAQAGARALSLVDATSVLGGRLLRGDHPAPHRRRRPGDGVADGRAAAAAWPRGQRGARHPV